MQIFKYVSNIKKYNNYVKQISIYINVKIYIRMVVRVEI